MKASTTSTSPLMEAVRASRVGRKLLGVVDLRLALFEDFVHYLDQVRTCMAPLAAFIESPLSNESIANAVPALTNVKNPWPR